MNISNDRYAFINSIVSSIDFFDELSLLTNKRVYITRKNFPYCVILESPHETIYFIDRLSDKYGEDTNEKSNKFIEQLYAEIQRHLKIKKDNKTLISISNKIKKLFPSIILKYELGE